MYNKYRPRRFCIICGKEISGTRRIKTCGCEDCIKQYNHLHYKETAKEKICKVCGEKFIGTYKQKTCEKCRKISHSRAKYKTIEQKIVCKQCGKQIKTIEKKVTANTVPILYTTCDECKEKNRKLNSEAASKRMMENNPMHNSEIAKKMGDTHRRNYEEKCRNNGIKPRPRQVKKDKKETKEETSMRMHLHNPMYNEETRKRVSETFKKKIKSGELKYKRGKEHHLWRGNRTLNKHIRLNLRKWVREKFEDANFTCQENGETHCELQVHHLIPLKDIIENFLEKYNTNSQEILLDEELLNKFTQDIVDYHFQHKEIGIVVCPKCHHKLDKKYRRLTYYHKENKVKQKFYED